MFTGLPLEPFPYIDPWDIPFEARLSEFTAREKRIAYFYVKPDTSTFRYRIFNMVEALNRAPELGISASWFTLDDLPYAGRFVDRADALVICRAHYTADINRLIGRARARGIPVFFDVDDFIFDTDYAHLLVHTLDQHIDDEIWDHWFGRISRLGATLRLCDGAIVTNPYLADRVAAFAPRVKTRIVPNYFNRAQQEFSEELWNLKRQSGFARDGRIHIGYFSGTPTHNRDFEIASSALIQLLEEDPRVTLRVVGFLDPKGPFLKYRDRIEVFPLQDFMNLQRLIGEVEINIAPLQSNAFTESKSELKYFEAAIVGTLTIASPSFTFRNCIRHGENALLARPHEWYSALRRAIDIVCDSRRFRRMAELASEEVRERYGWNRQAHLVAGAVLGSTAAHSAAQQVGRAAV